MNKFLGLILLVLPLTACIGTGNDEQAEVKVSKYNVNSFSMNKLVCDPFQDTSPTATSG